MLWNIVTSGTEAESLVTVTLWWRASGLCKSNCFWPLLCSNSASSPNKPLFERNMLTNILKYRFNLCANQRIASGRFYSAFHITAKPCCKPQLIQLKLNLIGYVVGVLCGTATTNVRGAT